MNLNHYFNLIALGFFHINKYNWNKKPKAIKSFGIRISSLIICQYQITRGAQWLSGRVLYSRVKGRGFEPHWRHCVVSLSKTINPSLVLVQPRNTRPFITERMLMGRKESNQTNKQTNKSQNVEKHFTPNIPAWCVKQPEVLFDFIFF